MNISKKLDIINNVFGVLGTLYTIIMIIIIFIFKENTNKILNLIIPSSLLLAILVLLIFIVIDYFKQKFKEIEHIDKRVKKLEDVLSLNKRFQKIEEKLIYQENIITNMLNKISLNKRGNAFLYTLLAILLIAFLVWMVWVLKTA